MPFYTLHVLQNFHTYESKKHLRGDTKNRTILCPGCSSEGSFDTQTQDFKQPISSDSDLIRELRGWYQAKDRFVQNEYGNRFYLDTYGSKWLAFSFEIKL